MDRRDRIVEEIRKSGKPLSASALAAMLHVSRQIIVGDVALLRARGIGIIATPRGYVLEEQTHPCEKKIAVMHGREQLQEELYTWSASCTCLPVMMSIVSWTASAKANRSVS